MNFECTVDVSTGWKYEWYKDERQLSYTTSTISIQLGASDGGKYSCKATRSEGTSTVRSEDVPVNVHGR